MSCGGGWGQPSCDCATYKKNTDCGTDTICGSSFDSTGVQISDIPNSCTNQCDYFTMDLYIPNTEDLTEVLVYDEFSVILCYDDISGSGFTNEEYILDQIIPVY